MKDLPLPFTSNELIQENINRLNKIKKECFINPNPYYVKGIFPTEYQEIKQWIDKFEKLKQKHPASVMMQGESKLIF